MRLLSAAAGLTLSVAATAATGEKLYFGAEWRFLDAGKAELIYSSEGAKLSLRTTGLADSLYGVRSNYSVFFNGDFCVSSSASDTREGKRHREASVTYGKTKAEYVERDVNKGGQVVRQSQVPVPPCVHDMLAALQTLRRLPNKPGDSFTVPVSDGRKSAAVRVEVQQKETIRSPAGVFPCIRYEAFVFDDVIYRRKARLLIWLTEESRHLPVRLQVKMPFWIGSVTLLLEKEGRD